MTHVSRLSMAANLPSLLRRCASRVYGRCSWPLAVIGWILAGGTTHGCSDLEYGSGSCGAHP
jgi:hypothetical protein